MPANEIETAVIDQLRGLLRAPEIVVRTWRAARRSGEDISEAEVREALERLDPLWDELFPAEQARIVQLLVERVDIHLDRLDVRLRTAGLTKLVDELRERPIPSMCGGRHDGGPIISVVMARRSRSRSRCGCGSAVDASSWSRQRALLPGRRSGRASTAPW